MNDLSINVDRRLLCFHKMPVICVKTCLSTQSDHKISYSPQNSAKPPAHSAQQTLSFLTWFPDGYYHIFRLYVFGPSGFWTMAPLRYAAIFDPFHSLDCAMVEGGGEQSKERNGSNFAVQQSGAIDQKPEGPNTYNLKIWLSPFGNHGRGRTLYPEGREMS